MNEFHDIPFVPQWTSLRRLGQSRVIQTSYFWILAVPMVAKLLEGSEGITIPIPQWTTSITLALPFTWQIFYYSAVAFAVASFIFAVKCPPVVAEHATYVEFKDAGKGGRQVLHEFLSMIITPRQKANDPLAGFYAQRLASEFLENAPSPLTIASLSSATISPDAVSDAYWFVRSCGDKHAPIYRIVCFISYLIGFGLIGTIMVQNFMYVVEAG